MKMEGRWTVVIWAMIAVIGISGIFEALPHASESVVDLAEDAGILAIAIAICVLLARKFGPRGRTVK
jgi:hypothetical protein